MLDLQEKYTKMDVVPYTRLQYNTYTSKFEGMKYFVKMIILLQNSSTGWRAEHRGFSTGTVGRTDRASVRGTRSCPRLSPSTSSCTSPCRPLWAPCTTCVRGSADSTAAAAAVGAAADRTALPRWARQRRRPAGRTRTPLGTNRGRTTTTT